MAKRKKKDNNPIADDLPKNLEFQEFADLTRRLMQVPKAEIDRRSQDGKKRPCEPGGDEPLAC